MNRSAKRGRLSSALLSAAKSAAAPDADWPDDALPSRESKAAETSADAAPAAMAGGEIARRVAEELRSADNLLFNKGAASAAAFKPAYWSYEADPPASTEPVAPVTPSDVAPEPPPAVRPRPRSNLWLAATACGCLVMVPPAVILALSLSRPVDEGPAISPPVVASDEAPPTVASDETAQSPPPAVIQADAAGLITRGDTFLGTGDIASARLYYEQAADAGSARAAMFLGLTFDPAFLDRAGTRGLHGDVSQAAMWYRRARDLGEPEAVRLLAGLDSN